jgi:hypothetical protein
VWGPDWTRAVGLLTYEQGVEAFRATDRLSNSDRAALTGETETRVHDWSPSKPDRLLSRAFHLPPIDARAIRAS